MDEGLRRSDRYSENLAHFFVLIAFDVVEQECGAARRRKLADGPLELQISSADSGSAGECVSFRQPCVAGGVRSCGPPVVASSGGPQRTGGRPRGSAQTLRWTGQRYC